MQWTVAIGIDTHKHTHVAVALDRLGAQLDAFEAPASSAGYLALYRWAHELGEPVFALEGSGSYGAGLARFLQAAGCSVYECERPKRSERRRGKNDLIDALLAARRLLTGEPLGSPRGLSGPREDLRLLLLERRSGARRARARAGGDRVGARPRADRRVRSRAGLRRSAGRLERRPQPDGERGLLRGSRRHEPGRRFERAAAAPSTEPGRRSPVEPGAARDRAQPRPLPRRNGGLPPATGRVGQDHSRGPTLRQADARPLLPPQALLAAGPGLDNIEASRPSSMEAPQAVPQRRFRRDPGRARRVDGYPRRRGASHRPEAPEVRPAARRPAGRGNRRGWSRLPGGAAGGGRRAARLRLPARPQGATARVSQRLEAMLAGASRRAVPRGAGLRGAGGRAGDSARRDRSQRPAQIEPRGDARDPARAVAAGRSMSRRRLPPWPDGASPQRD